MDYPHGHVGHHRHHGRDDDDNSDNYQHGHVKHDHYHGREDDNYPPPPPHVEPTYPPSYGGAYDAPPPPQQHSYGNAFNQPPPPQQHSYGNAFNQPPPPQQDYYGGAYDAPPPPPPHFHSSPAQPPSYGGGGPTPTQSHHGFKPHMPSFHGSHSHSHGPEYQGGGPEMGSGLGQLENKASNLIHCKAGGERYVFGIRDDKVVLTPPDSSDLTQQWYKDETYSTKVKDKEGHPCFMLVNKGTGQAVKHSVSCHPVQLAPYRPNVLDEAVLWTESKDLGSGYRMIRTVNNVHLVMDAWNADKDHGGIHDGTVIALYETWKGDNQNQQWKFVRH